MWQTSMIYLCILFVLDKHTRHQAIVLCFNCLVITAGTMRSDNFCERYTDHFHKKGQQLNRTKSQIVTDCVREMWSQHFATKIATVAQNVVVTNSKSCGHCRCVREMWSQHFATPLVASTKRFPAMAVLLQNHRLQNYASLTLKNKNINVNLNLNININSKQLAQIVWHHNWYSSHVLDISYFKFQFNSQLVRFWQGWEELRSF